MTEQVATVKDELIPNAVVSGAIDNEAEVNDAFSQGFSGNQGQTETPDDDKPTEPIAEVEAQIVETPPELVQLTRAEYDKLMSAAASINDLTSRTTKGIDTAFGKIGSLEQRLTDMASSSTVDVTDEDFVELITEYPELAPFAITGIKRIVGKMKGNGGAELSADKVKELMQEQMATITDEVNDTINRNQVIKALTKKHKDWQQIDADPAFAQFLTTMPTDDQVRYQEANINYDEDVLIEVMDRYKAEVAKATAPPPATVKVTQARTRIEAATQPKGDRGNTEVTDSEEEAFRQGFKTG